MWGDCYSKFQQGEMVYVGHTVHRSSKLYIGLITAIIQISKSQLIIVLFEFMAEVADSMLFRQKLYEMFKDSGLQSKLKTTLRASLLQKLEKPNQIYIPKPEQDTNKPFHLRSKYLESIIAEFLKARGKEYSLSIFMAECELQQQDCLRYGELSQIANLGKSADNESFLYRLVEEFGKIRCQQARQRSTQTDFDEPLSKKLELIDKEYKNKIDYWKLIPGSSMSKAPDLVDQEQRLRGQFAVEKERMKRELEVSLKQEIQKKLENRYNFRLHQAQKQHEGRLNELKLREKTVLDGLERKKKQIQEKSQWIREEQLKLINKYESKMLNLQTQHRKRTKQLQQKEKDFWKKELQLRAKKREYQQTIRLVKQKVIEQSGDSK